MNLLKVKICIVTGGVRGIDKAISKKVIVEGGVVIIADIEHSTGTATADDLGEQCTFIKTDVSNSDTVKSRKKREKEKKNRLRRGHDLRVRLFARALAPSREIEARDR